MIEILQKEKLEQVSKKGFEGDEKEWCGRQ